MANKTPEYKTFRSPDGKNTQKVGSKVRETELRFAGWTEDKTTASATKTTTKTDTPKETGK